MDIGSGGYKHIFFKGGVNACQYNLGNLHVFTCILCTFKNSDASLGEGVGVKLLFGQCQQCPI